MLSLPFAGEIAPDVEADDEDEDARESAYVFEGYEIDSSVRIMLTPQGLSADRHSAG
jgi:hypothetical protein